MLRKTLRMVCLPQYRTLKPAALPCGQGIHPLTQWHLSTWSKEKPCGWWGKEAAKPPVQVRARQPGATGWGSVRGPGRQISPHRHYLDKENAEALVCMF